MCGIRLKFFFGFFGDFFVFFQLHLDFLFLSVRGHFNSLYSFSSVLFITRFLLCAKQPHNQNASVKRTPRKCVHLPFSIQVRYCYYITFHYRFFFFYCRIIWSGYYTFRAISIPYIKWIEHSLSSSSTPPPFLIITIIFAFMAKWFFAIHINTQSRFFFLRSSLASFLHSFVRLLSLVVVVRCRMCVVAHNNICSSMLSAFCDYK